MASSSGFGTPHFRSSASSPLEPPPSGSADSSSSSALDLNNLKQEIVLKILVLGDLGVGKTSLVRRYTEGDASGSGADSYMVSIDIGFKRKSVEIDGRTVHIQLWDIPGNERFGGMTKVYYKYAHGALIVFDLARPETFENALSWLSDVTEKLFDEKQKLIDLNDSQNLADANKAMPIVLLANKCDLPELKVPRQKYSSYVQENGLLGWYETSSRDHSNISLAIRRLVEYILENDQSVKVAKENAKLWKNM